MSESMQVTRSMNKRILIFSTSYFPLVGGAEVAIRQLTDRLPDYEFVLICAKLEQGLASHERIGRVDVHRVGLGLSLDKILLIFFGPLVGLSLTRANREPLVWSMMANYAGFASLFFTWLKPRARFLLTLQEGLPMEYFVERTRYIGWLYRGIFRRANALQAISRYLAVWSKRLGFQGEPEIIPNGVDLSLFNRPFDQSVRSARRAEAGFSENDKVIITTSRLSQKNGVADLIEALAFLPDAYKLLIIGEGEDGPTLREQAKRFTSRVVFIGSKPYAELPDWLQAADIFCRPSLSEGLGNSFLEAMAAGVPIVGTPVGGIPDFLKDGETGLFCAVQDPQSIASAIRRLVEDEPLRQRVMAAARQLALRDYDWDLIAKQFDLLIRRLLN